MQGVFIILDLKHPALNLSGFFFKKSINIKTINRTALRRLIVPIPKPKEQDQIVERLEAAEDHISNLNRQLDSARRVKQSLLQNLLAGRVRLTV